MRGRARAREIKEVAQMRDPLFREACSRLLPQERTTGSVSSRPRAVPVPATPLVLMPPSDPWPPSNVHPSGRDERPPAIDHDTRPRHLEAPPSDSGPNPIRVVPLTDSLVHTLEKQSDVALNGDGT